MAFYTLPRSTGSACQCVGADLVMGTGDLCLCMFADTLVF